MTREEAIYELQEDKRLYETEVCHAGDGTPDGRLLEAIDMAIEALSTDAVQGEWNKFDTGIYLCSNCNWAVGKEYNYCPCCGARMENTK